MRFNMSSKSSVMALFSTAAVILGTVLLRGADAMAWEQNQVNTTMCNWSQLRGEATWNTSSITMEPSRIYFDLGG